ncbi:hypothetical protein NC652_034391 [Populus alba x Populus x berolinensis]|nr:hypothetical protein NC652_034391 [Populus alba x Populus x berolinensis]
MDAGVNKDNCSSLPQHPLTITNFNYGDPYNPPISLSSFGEKKGATYQANVFHAPQKISLAA